MPLILAALLSLLGTGGLRADDALQTRGDLKGAAKTSAKASTARSGEQTKQDGGAAFGDAQRRGGARARGVRIDRVLQPDAMAPGTPSSTGGPVQGMSYADAPEVGQTKNVTPYQAEIDQVTATIKTNTLRLVGGAEAARDPSASGAGRVSGLSTLFIGVIIAIVGGLLGKAFGQSLQGALITAVGAFLGATAIQMIAGAKPSPEAVEQGVQMAGSSHRRQMRENFTQLGTRVTELDDSAPAEDQ